MKSPEQEARCRCGYVFRSHGPIQDIDGCLLPHGHEGCHEFLDSDGDIFQWEYDLQNDEDVYWEKPNP